MRLIVQSAAPGRWRALLMTAAFTGLRASELRGLRWEHVDFDAGEIAVVQRADRYNQIGSPKSAAGGRRVPLTPVRGEHAQGVEAGVGRPGLRLRHAQGRERRRAWRTSPTGRLVPAQVKAGLTRPMLDDEGQPVLDEEGAPRVGGQDTGCTRSGTSSPSWCINPRSAGGLELPAKVVQERLGHETINITLDMYAHLFPRGDDRAALAAGERAILGDLHATWTFTRHIRDMRPN